ncbi:MAG: hypothetical protein JW929_08060 [Anaerolineales bacterium]|nr:hypothetical protein [Anaerolineales bacterium]
MFTLPIFPIYIPFLRSLFPYGANIWLGGVVLLWLTRYTRPLGTRWGRPYCILSAVLRLLGAIAIAAGWLAPFTPYAAGDEPRITWPVSHSAVEWVTWIAILLCFGFGLWSVAVLGLRRSFLFRRLDDAPVVRGPYAPVRRPKFLSAIGITLFNPLTTPDIAPPGPRRSIPIRC